MWRRKSEKLQNKKQKNAKVYVQFFSTYTIIKIQRIVFIRFVYSDSKYSDSNSLNVSSDRICIALKFGPCNFLTSIRTYFFFKDKAEVVLQLH